MIKPNKRFERDDPPASIACRDRATLVARYKELLTRISNTEKLNLEKWVVRQLLGALGISFKEEEMTGAAEPVDVAFRDARFQVKEILDEGRHRTDEFKNKLKRIEQGQDNSGLLEEYTPLDISFTEIVQLCHSYAKSLESKYGPRERKSIDLLCYFNWHHHFSMVPPTEVFTKEVGFRSLSVVSNRYCAVVYASPNAPALLRDNVGKVFFTSC